jgi:hypothetical protein
VTACTLLGSPPYVVFGKQDTDAVELSAIASGAGGFVIVGELTNDEYSHSISNAGVGG